MKIFKTAKVTFDFTVTMVTTYIRELLNAHQKNPPPAPRLDRVGEIAFFT